MITNLAKLVLENKGEVIPSIIPSEETNGTGLCNSSIFIDDNGDILLNIRHVQYTLYHSEFEQKYPSYWGRLAYLNPEDDITLRTWNYLCKLDPDTLLVKEYHKVNTCEFDIEPVWEFIGLEDARVVRWNDILYLCGVRRDVKDDGEGRMELSTVQWNEEGVKEISRDRITPPVHTHLEKNWMPILDMPYHFIKWTFPLEIVKVDPNKKTQQKVQEGFTINIPSKTVVTKEGTRPGKRDIRGGSQVIPFGEHRLAIIHETDYWRHESNEKDAQYYHRFMFWDKDWNVVKMTEPFKFMDAQIEFSCGLAQQGNSLLISFGYQDNSAYILKMPIEVLDQLPYTELNG